MVEVLPLDVACADVGGVRIAHDHMPLAAGVADHVWTLQEIAVLLD